MERTAFSDRRSPETERPIMSRVSRKPMDKLNGYDSREAVWSAIRRLPSFTVRDLQQETTLEISTVRDYVTGLMKAGYLRVIAESRATVYILVKNVGVDAPRVRKDGSLVTQGQGQINMWRTMFVLRTFTVKKLAVTASTEDCIVSVNAADDYVKHLCVAGYLKKKDDEYFFPPHMFTGPKPPMIQKVKRVWDQNLKKVMWSELGGDK
jgi:hypothetical protein